MELNVDQPKPVPATTASLDPSQVWALGSAVDDVRSVVGPGKGQYSYLADCECPGDCLRDHENE